MHIYSGEGGWEAREVGRGEGRGGREEGGGGRVGGKGGREGREGGEGMEGGRGREGGERGMEGERGRGERGRGRGREGGARAKLGFPPSLPLFARAPPSHPRSHPPSFVRLGFPPALPHCLLYFLKLYNVFNANVQSIR